ncbi:similar to Saccharomyces cerevisiae YGL139W FLC3 Putative FAD transporter, similar to Flc1p and Flc2p [Maudiozyma saulgeensis]|uniref:Similar to Saccharomyces cerevisiae YGL139W FLC3 Putative FAD transporter, similar to Flc1p and Flc2p n=1 Tax=Maudiozyma saulgeensis TaxID=1789683 RepID=A0A1X7R0K3_9SACH|nr:similar to Saccharomyces cerevisiae YGL139W FLC3 Putative FAD transporter, similar to Flc1p and Flc2p [Kazachstania saulgeensis]
MQPLLKYIIQLLLLSQYVFAKRNLVATSLVTCMEGSQISSNSFDVVFQPDDRSLHYTLDLTTQIDSYILAYIDVYAYGFKIITKNFDVCSENWKQFCPVHPGNIEIDSIEYISKDLTDEIPGIAYNVPDIDAYAIVKVYSANSTEYLACIQVFFSNGKTVSQTGVKWATAVVAGIGLLLSAILSTFGNSTAASHISANTMSLFLYFQSVAVIAMEHVHRVPPIAAAWAENLAWSMGLIRITFMQKIFRWYVQSTGGTPSLYLTATTMSVLTQRAIDFTSPLWKRAENILYGNQNTLIFRGIRRLGYRMNIENTAIVCTGFTFFVLCGYVLAGFIMVCKYSFELGIRAGWINPNRFHEFRTNWRIILKGALLRYIYIGFTQLTILSFWEFTERDSGAVITIACLFIVLSVGLMGWAMFRTHYFAQISIKQYNNPAAILYGDQRILHKYGFFYTMFNAAHYWWNAVLLTYIFVKSLFIGFAQASGKTQALAIFILDLFYFIAIIYYKPYLDKPTNIMNILICTVTLVNSFLFMFFSDLFHQNYTVSAVMGWVFFIMNAAFSFILLMMILAFTLMIVCSKNPDLRFKPANDDRTSFQRNTAQLTDGMTNGTPAAKELLELGNVAKEHNANWESDLFHNNDEENKVYRNKSFSTSANFIKRLSSFKLGRNASRTSVPSNPFADRLAVADPSSNTLSNINTVSNLDYREVTPSDNRLESELNLESSTGSESKIQLNPNLNTNSSVAMNTTSDFSDPFRDANGEKAT